MISVCSYCQPGQNVIAEVSPLEDKRETHGACRYHFLLGLESQGLLTADERRELNEIKWKRFRSGVLG